MNNKAQMYRKEKQVKEIGQVRYKDWDCLVLLSAYHNERSRLLLVQK